MKKVKIHKVNNFAKINYDEILEKMKLLVYRLYFIKVKAKLDQVPRSELIANILKIKDENEALESRWMPRDNVRVVTFYYSLREMFPSLCNCVQQLCALIFMIRKNDNGYFQDRTRE